MQTTPVDFSPRAADALSVATAVAATVGLDELHALHVRFNPAAVTFDEYEEIELANEHEAFALFVAPIDLNGIHVKPIFEESAEVAATVRRVAEETGTDLIVMGTRGRSAASAVLLGSETEQVIVESRIPVLAVKHFGARRRLLEVLLDELGYDVVHVGAGHVHLVKSLHGRDAGCGARGDFAGPRFSFGSHAGTSQKARFVSIRRRQARAASPPLPLMPPSARAIACSRVSTVRIAFPTGIDCFIATYISQ